ncbi:hypothetical protein PMG11_08551 [Penicillium brasilianum]|uniref:Uncharacterized protein n=1 Tax=Penicillium brasilianum TaxID=104259 RepID=A0A0F7TT84_PENBI|nr:hypothetical protein PMG11_08551 [Penicillium brasilianum]
MSTGNIFFTILQDFAVAGLQILNHSIGLDRLVAGVSRRKGEIDEGEIEIERNGSDGWSIKSDDPQESVTVAPEGSSISNLDVLGKYRYLDPTRHITIPVTKGV